MTPEELVAQLETQMKEKMNVAADEIQKFYSDLIEKVKSLKSDSSEVDALKKEVEALKAKIDQATQVLKG